MKSYELEALVNIAELAGVDRNEVATQYGEWCNLNQDKAYERTLRFIHFIGRRQKQKDYWDGL